MVQSSVLWLTVAGCLCAGCAPHFPIAQYGMRGAEEEEMRNELVVQVALPVPVGSGPDWLVKNAADAGSYSFLRLTPAFYYEDRQFVNFDDDYNATTTGIGRLYYQIGANTHASVWLTVDRELSIDYLNLSGQKVTARDDEQFLPGFQLAGTLSGFTGFVQGELYSYSNPDNFRLITGVVAGPKATDTHSYSDTFKLVLLYDLHSWEIQTSRAGQYVEMDGYSHGFYLKLNYQTQSFATIGAAIGYEWLSNSGSPGILDPADVDQNGVVYLLQVGFGMLMW